MTFTATRHFALAACAGILFAAPCSAQDVVAGRAMTGQIGGSINNPGLQTTFEVSWRSDAKISAGVVHALTPTQTRLGGWVQYSPLRMLDIRAGVDPSAYFGTFNSLQGFDSYGDAFDTDARDARAGAKAGFSVRSYVAPTLKLKAGPFVAAGTAELEWWRSNAGAEFFYEPTRDTLLKSGGDRMLRTTGVVMYQRALGAGSLGIGAIHTTSRVFDAPENDVRKIGALAIRQFAGRRFGLPRPKLTLMAGRYLADPSKDGQWTAAAAIGFSTR